MSVQTATWQHEHVRPQKLSFRRLFLWFVKGAIALGFVALTLSWPGLALLSLIYLFGGYCAAFAGASLHAHFVEGDRTAWWLHALGCVVLALGVLTLSGFGDGACIIPVAVGAWMVARGKDLWLVLTGLLVFMAGLTLGAANHGAMLPFVALFGIHALSTGVMLVALSPRRSAPLPVIRNHFS
jgi:uncharacterized membrane protein HdeD (DUF308 family)